MGQAPSKIFRATEMSTCFRSGTNMLHRPNNNNNNDNDNDNDNKY